MKLFFSPGACSLAPHIVLREAGLSFELDQVNLGTKQTASGKDFLQINPKGYVPTLQLDNGQVLTEGAVILQYLADQVPRKHLAPPSGTLERFHLMEWLTFISSELHKAFSPLFNSKTPEEYRVIVRENLTKRIGFVAKQLEKTDYIGGDQFSIADAYLFTVLCWTRPTKMDLAPWPSVVAYMDRVGSRPAVHAAMIAEGLIKG
ncbi:MAG: glutathione transferase GstA [Burkholderiaceae bacterium]|nr:glutathione transferase GstA [Burkholderiaceae bacterium]